MSAEALLVIEPGTVEPVARLGDWLIEAGATLEICRPAVGDTVPDSLDGFAGLVVMGGAMGCHDDETAPWLPAIRSLLGRAVADDLPTLAVCLGAQLLAVATGGRVARMDEPELGALLVAKRTSCATDPLFRSLPIAPDVIQWHFDEVVDLPPAATLLVSSPVAPHQAFRVGALAWGIQFHIETTPDIVRTWARNDAPHLPNVDFDALIARVDAVDADLVEVWQPFAASFMDVVRAPQELAPRRGLPLAQTSIAEPITDPAAIRAALAAEMQAVRGTHH